LKPLILGSTGQLGAALLARAKSLGLEAHGTGRSELNFAHCQDNPLGFEAQLGALIDAHTPSHILIAAAYTAVDKAEQNLDTAEAVNARAPASIGRVAALRGIPVVHYSTDYVFNGQKPLSQAYSPNPAIDPLDPQSVYGRTKAAGEQGLLGSASDALVFRTSWVFSASGNNFLKTMIRLAQEREHLRVVSDQVGAPTSAEWLAEASLQICSRWPLPKASPPLRGVYHLTAGGSVSWHGFAQSLLEGARELAPERHWTIQSNEQIEAITTAQFNAPAPRPQNSQLDCARTEADFQIKRPAWQDQMRAVLRTLLGA
jgi:dTDP-4-dehydrorhamnose reductase